MLNNYNNSMTIIILFLCRNGLADFELDFKQEVRKLYVLIVIIIMIVIITCRIKLL